MARLSEKIRTSAQGDHIDPNRVAIYIRWSTEDQGDGTTLEVQRRNCEMFVQSQGWYINPDLLFVDDGYSGGSLDRPAITKLRAEVKQGNIHCVVVFKLDRLSRSVLDTVNLVLDEWDGICHLKSATQPLDTRDPLGKQFFYMLVGFAEYERQLIKERTFSGKLERASEGKNPGQVAPYGFTYGPLPGSFQIVPGETAIVKRIFAHSLAGNGAATICKELNAEGIPYVDHRNGKSTTWKEVTIRYMLSNPFYTGRLVYGQSRVNQRKKAGEPHRIRPDQPLVDTEAIILNEQGERSSPPIDLATFEENLRRMKARQDRNTSNRVWLAPHLLTGLARCQQCGRTLQGRKKQVTPTGGTYAPAYYLCSGSRENGVCSNGYVRQDDLDSVVVNRVMERYGNAIRRQAIIDAAQADILAAIKQQETVLSGLRDDLADYERQQGDLRADYLARKMTIDEYRDFKAHLDAEFEATKAKERKALDRMAELETRRKAQGDLARLATQLDSWAALTDEQKKALLSDFIVEVKAYRPKGSTETTVEIVWREGA